MPRTLVRLFHVLHFQSTPYNVETAQAALRNPNQVPPVVFQTTNSVAGFGRTIKYFCRSDRAGGRGRVAHVCPEPHVTYGKKFPSFLMFSKYL